MQPHSLFLPSLIVLQEMGREIHGMRLGEALQLKNFRCDIWVSKDLGDWPIACVAYHVTCNGNHQVGNNRDRPYSPVIPELLLVI